MNNKDFTYLIIFVLIFVSSIISQKKQNLPNYTRSLIFDVIMLLNIIVTLHLNVYIGVFITYTYLIVKIKNN